MKTSRMQIPMWSEGAGNIYAKVKYEDKTNYTLEKCTMLQNDPNLKGVEICAKIKVRGGQEREEIVLRSKSTGKEGIVPVNTVVVTTIGQDMPEKLSAKTKFAALWSTVSGFAELGIENLMKEAKSAEEQPYGFKTTMQIMEYAIKQVKS